MTRSLDWVALGAYLVAVMALGLYFARRNKDFQAYMFGGGKVPWVAVGISLIATSVSATTFLGNPADAYANNMTYLMCNIGGIFAVAIIGWIFIPKIRRLHVQSAYELLEIHFSLSVRRLASVFFCCHLLLRTGVLLYGPALVLSGMTGIPLGAAILLTSVLATIYTLLGGIRAVIWTDVMQFVVLVVGGGAVLWVCSNAVGGVGEMWHLATEAGKTQWLDFSWDPTNPRTFLSAALVYTIFEVAIRGCDQQFVQRYLSCKDERSANLSSYLSVFLGLGIGLLFFSVGAALYVFYQIKMAGTLPEGTGVNEVFPYFIINVLPPGLTGILVAAIFAAAMSSLDSALTALSNTSVMDFRGGRSGGADENPHQLREAKKWVILWGILGTAAALACAVGEKSLLAKALFFTSLFTGPLLGMFITAFFFGGTQARAVLWGAIGGMICLLPFSSIPWVPESVWSPVYRFSWPWNPFISLVGTLVLTGLFNRFIFREKLG